MSGEIVTMLGVGATLLASGGTFALFLFRLFVRLEDKVNDLARDHRSLAGEISELRERLARIEGLIDGLVRRRDRDAPAAGQPSS